MIGREGNSSNLIIDESCLLRSSDTTDNNVDRCQGGKDAENMWDLSEFYMLMARCDLPDI
jgi:hypothetical protein